MVTTRSHQHEVNARGLGGLGIAGAVTYKQGLFRGDAGVADDQFQSLWVGLPGVNVVAADNLRNSLDLQQIESRCDGVMEVDGKDGQSNVLLLIDAPHLGHDALKGLLLDYPLPLMWSQHFEKLRDMGFMLGSETVHLSPHRRKRAVKAEVAGPTGKLLPNECPVDGEAGERAIVVEDKQALGSRGPAQID